MARTTDTEVRDHVIVGAGSAGCALAARLSAAGGRVLPLEAGGTEGRGARAPDREPAA